MGTWWPIVLCHFNHTSLLARYDDGKILLKCTLINNFNFWNIYEHWTNKHQHFTAYICNIYRTILARKSRCSRRNSKMAFLAEWGVLSGNYFVFLGKMFFIEKWGVLIINKKLISFKISANMPYICSKKFSKKYDFPCFPSRYFVAILNIALRHWIHINTQMSIVYRNVLLFY